MGIVSVYRACPGCLLLDLKLGKQPNSPSADEVEPADSLLEMVCERCERCVRLHLLTSAVCVVDSISVCLLTPNISRYEGGASATKEKKCVIQSSSEVSRIYS